ncbi:hypothetical protein ACTQZR_01185 [Catenibacterium mitsuokai]|uniref:hypothetical protein n=1 Tax=Catenibacterium mitsuokai TaxID=100886 RepID=UPI003F9207D8
MGLEYIYTDSNYNELGYLTHFDADIELGEYDVSKNDFELTLSLEDRDPLFTIGSLFYKENTEAGGVIQRLKINTSDNTITMIGPTFRGLLEKEYVQPSNGSAYLTLNGEANACINTLICDRFDGLFVVDNIGASNINVKYDVRDINLLQALDKALGASNARLCIRHRVDGKIHLYAEKINDLSDILQYDNDYQIGMIVKTESKPYNHIIALGKGELLDRLRINLYLQTDGSWSESNQVYTGLDRKTYKHEDVNVDDRAELIKNATEKAIEANESDTLEISFGADNAELFDIVGAKENITGISFKEPITQKIIKISDGDISISYKVGDAK